jgi:hypothetical protein
MKNVAQNFFVEYHYHSLLYKSNEQTKTGYSNSKPFALSSNLPIPPEQLLEDNS